MHKFKSGRTRTTASYDYDVAAFELVHLVRSQAFISNLHMFFKSKFNLRAYARKSNFVNLDHDVCYKILLVSIEIQFKRVCAQIEFC